MLIGSVTMSNILSEEKKQQVIAMDLDFVVSRQLVQPSRLSSSSCSLARTFDPRFLQTPPRGGCPCASLAFTSIRLARDFHPVSLRACPARVKNLAQRTGLFENIKTFSIDALALVYDAECSAESLCDYLVSHRARNVAVFP